MVQYNQLSQLVVIIFVKCPYNISLLSVTNLCIYNNNNNNNDLLQCQILKAQKGVLCRIVVNKCLQFFGLIDCNPLQYRYIQYQMIKQCSILTFLFRPCLFVSALCSRV